MKNLCAIFLVPVLFLAAPAARAQSQSSQPLGSGFAAAGLEFRTSMIVDRAPAQLVELQALLASLFQNAARWQRRFEEIEAYVVRAARERMRLELAALDEMVASGQLVSRVRYEQKASLIRRIAARTIELVQAPNMRPRLAEIVADLLGAGFQARRAHSRGGFAALRPVPTGGLQLAPLRY
jgi:hypothetical protein